MKKVDVIVNYPDYVKMKKHFPYSFRKKFTITSIVIILVFMLALIPPDSSTISDVAMADILFIAAAYFLLKIIDILFRKQKYKKELYRYPEHMKYTLSFYEDYLEKKSETVTKKIFYYQIKKKLETIDAIYFLLNSKEILLIKKEDCNSELLDYLEEIHVDKQSIQCLKSSNTENDAKFDKKISRIKLVLMILFILTILSLIGGMILPQVLTLRDIPSFIVKYFPNVTLHLGIVHIDFPSVFNISYLWSACFFLPITILSVVLGIVYRRKGFKCIKNIVAGIIVTVLLSCMIYFSYHDDYQIEKDYQETNAYHSIIGEILPKEGRMFQMIWYNSNSESTYFYFEDAKENEKFRKKIQKNNHWILAKDVNTDLSYFVINSCHSTKEPCYYSVYIEELETYNKVPKETGLYTIYSMLYDTEIHSIKMQKFIYQYRK